MTVFSPELELTPPTNLPDLYQKTNIDPELCKQYGARALELMIEAEGIEMYHVCDSDPQLSEMTEAILDLTVEATGLFDGPTYATVTGYNLPSDIYGKGNFSNYHRDGCDTVAIISMTGQAELHLAWRPVIDSNGHRLRRDYDPEINSDPKVKITRHLSPVGYVAPIDVVECQSGTLVRIDQPLEYILDDDGNLWDFEHGLFDARGERIALQLRSHGVEGDKNKELEGSKPRHPSVPVV